MANLIRALVTMYLVLGVASSPAMAAEDTVKIAPFWDQVAMTSRTTLSIDVCVYPHILRDHPLHEKVWQAFGDFEGDYQRILFWYSYPRLSVAELYPPTGGKTSWNFTLLDPIVEDFMKSAKGRPVVMDMGTVPNWIYTPTPQPIPADPKELVWHYYAEKPSATPIRSAPAGGQPRKFAPRLSDEKVKLIAEYQARLAGWYTKGGFQDEFGVWHKSGYAYKFDYWEVLSEPDLEWGLSPQDYTRVYDATVEAVRKVNPEMKFVGLSLASPRLPEHFFYFLDPANHKPGIPLDMISFHSYSRAEFDENDPIKYQRALFRQVDAYGGLLTYVKAIRDRLSPNTRISINEVGDFLPRSFDPEPAPIADSYWNLMAAMSAYHYALMVDMGIDIVNQAELIDYPGQSPSTTLLAWQTGEPNARYRAMKLLRDSFGAGDKVVASPLNSGASAVADKGFIGRDGKRRVLLVNKRDQPVTVEVEGAAQGFVQVVDRTTRGKPQPVELKSGTLKLEGFAVAVVTLK